MVAPSGEAVVWILCFLALRRVGVYGILVLCAFVSAFSGWQSLVLYVASAWLHNVRVAAYWLNDPGAIIHG